MLITEKGMVVRAPIKDVRTTGRSTQGVRLMRLEAGDKISSVAKIVPEDEDEVAIAGEAKKEAQPAAAQEAKPKAAEEKKVVPEKGEAKKEAKLEPKKADKKQPKKK
jgi:DNA gyrase subunit A